MPDKLQWMNDCQLQSGNQVHPEVVNSCVPHEALALPGLLECAGACTHAQSLHSYSTLCDPMDYSPPSYSRFSWQEYWSGLPCPPPGKPPDPVIEPTSPTLQADSLPLSTWEAPSTCTSQYLAIQYSSRFEPRLSYLMSWRRQGSSLSVEAENIR